MKLSSIVLIVSISLLSSPVNSYYRGDNSSPMVKMMVLMMEMMGRFMLGNSLLNKFPASGLNYSSLPYSSFPMSPLLYNASPNISGLNGFSSYNPFAQAQAAKRLEDRILNKQTTNIYNNYSMNGIWQSSSGDIMVIYYNKKFIWTDGKARHLVGTLTINKNQFIVNIAKNNQQIKFQFYRENNQFAVKNKQGHMYVFKKIY